MPGLVDQFGRPIQTEELSREVASPTVTGVRNVWRDSQASRLTPERLAGILERAAQGDSRDYLTLAEEMEEREPHYASVLSQRKHAVSGLDVVVEAASDDAHDVKLADEIRALVNRPEMSDATEDLLDALGKSYSVVEIIWDRAARHWEPIAFKHRDPQFFTFDRVTGRELRLLDESNPTEGLALTPYKFMVHLPRLKTGLPVRGGLARIVAAAYMCKAYDITDWMAFAEVFGMPLRLGRYGPQASEKEIATLTRAVANIGTDAAAVIPRTMEIEFIDGKATAGGDVFEKLAVFLDKQVSKAVVGQTMTSDDGSSLAQSQTHNEVRKDLVRSDAKQLSSTLSRDLVRPYIDLNYGPQRRYPVVRVFVPEPKDLKVLSDALAPLVDRGMRVEASVLRDMFGLPDPPKDAEVLVPANVARAIPVPAPVEKPTPPQRTARNAQETPRSDAIDELEADELDDWEPMMDGLLDPLRRAVESASSLEQLRVDLPKLLEGMDASVFVERLALRMFQARALGDARDEPGV